MFFPFQKRPSRLQVWKKSYRIHLLRFYLRRGAVCSLRSLAGRIVGLLIGLRIGSSLGLWVVGMRVSKSNEMKQCTSKRTGAKGWYGIPSPKKAIGYNITYKVEYIRQCECTRCVSSFEFQHRLSDELHIHILRFSLRTPGCFWFRRFYTECPGPCFGSGFIRWSTFSGENWGIDALC